jgi:hypothetical protein
MGAPFPFYLYEVERLLLTNSITLQHINISITQWIVKGHQLIIITKYNQWTQLTGNGQIKYSLRSYLSVLFGSWHGN